MLAESNPYVAARCITWRLPIAANQLGFKTQFDEFSPGPECMVLAISFPKVLEGSRVQPEIGLFKENVVTYVLAFG